MNTFHAVEVVGVRVEMPSNQPIVLLKEIDGIRYLPIWVGSVEATAIAFAQQSLLPPRPLTHDLLVTVISELGGEGLSTISKVDHESMTGEELPPIVELGVDNYDFPETTDGYGAIPFSARMEGGFTCINGLGMTYLVSQNEMVKIAGRY